MKGEARQLGRHEYPALLREIPDAPPSVWMRGTFPPPGTAYLAVVGSRALSSYGKSACEYLIEGLRGYPISIVSGLAFGADACAHQAALRAGLHTIAIPGSGLDDSVIAPKSNLGLAHAILEAGGALLSEHEPMHVSTPYDFPSRNRIMAGMSSATLIIEAAERSGTLITARLATEYNRDLLAVPHRIKDPHGFGGHLFIRLGATLVSEPAHILEALGIKGEKKEAAPMPELEGAERALYELLREALPRDELIRLSKLPAGVALTALVSLELAGLAKEEFGAWHRV